MENKKNISVKEATEMAKDNFKKEIEEFNNLVSKKIGVKEDK